MSDDRNQVESNSRRISDLEYKLDQLLEILGLLNGLRDGEEQPDG